MSMFLVHLNLPDTNSSFSPSLARTITRHRWPVATMTAWQSHGEHERRQYRRRWLYCCYYRGRQTRALRSPVRYTCYDAAASSEAERERRLTQDLLYYRVNNMQEKPVEASHHISTNHPVSQSYIYQTPLVHDSPASRTEQHKQPPCSVRDAILETLRVLPGKTATTPVPADLLKLKISQSLIIYHSFHQSIQIFNSPPVPMLLFKHKTNPSKILNKQ